MTDGELAVDAMLANEIELSARAHMQASGGREREAAQSILRQAVALRKALEQLIVSRAIQAQREQAAVAR